MLQLVARMGVYKIIKTRGGKWLSLQDGLQLAFVHAQCNRTEDASEATGKKMISLAALFRGRKSLLRTKREKPTPVGTGDDLEKGLNHANKREGNKVRNSSVMP